jgi:ABC-type polysaccharide/polyol phosphate export permease
MGIWAACTIRDVGGPDRDGLVRLRPELSVEAAAGAGGVVLDAPPPELLHRRRLRLPRSLRRLWQVRELVWTVAERDFRVRYKQAALGVAWAVLTPLLLMGAFTVAFQRVADIDTGGIPYPLFAIVGLVPWTFVSTSMNQGSLSLISNKSLLNKVACPREVFPIASVGVAGIDATLALSAVALVFVANGFTPRGTSYWVPLLLLVQVAFALGLSLLVSVSVVYLRDIRYLVPIVLQLGLFVTPVGYSFDAIAAGIRPVYALVNPLAPVIDGYRRTVLQGLPPQWGLLALGATGALIYLVVGYTVFKRLEGGIADVA